MSLARREKLWLGLLALTVLAGLWPQPEGEIADNSRVAPAPGRNAPSRAPAVREFGALSPAATAEQAALVDLFPSQSWTSPPSAAPAKPSAPPLPFSYGGRYTEGTNVFVFLKEGTLVHTARQGDTVKGSYRIDEIGAAAITLTYLPLGLRQTLPTAIETPGK